jgi:antitoxin VapB
MAPALGSMYIDRARVNTLEAGMALRIANPVVVAKVERLAKATGLTKTAVVERAIDRLASETQRASDPVRNGARMAALLAQLDRVPERTDASDPLEWDATGLPK